MWSKISTALHKQKADPEPSSSSSGEVMSKVLEQHPNMSVFHGSAEHSSPPSSPSKKKSRFKRLSKATPAHIDHDEPLRAPSPMFSLPRKVKSTLNFNSTTNNSQVSLASHASTIIRRTSQDLLRPSQDGSYASIRSERHGPALEMLRTKDLPIHPGQENAPGTPAGDKFGSVRSILRDPNTPGTGQNVRFFSRDAYNVISPNQSVDTEQPPALSSLAPAATTMDASFPNSPQTSHSVSVVPRSASFAKSSRPSVADVFSPLRDNNSIVSSSAPVLPDPVSADLSFELPSFPPPGLEMDLNLPHLDNSFMTEQSGAQKGPMSSTPYRDIKGKGKAVAENKENSFHIDETIFHSQEVSPPPRLPNTLHDRSNSFSFGQTIFFSMENNSNSGHDSSARSSLVPSEVKGSPASYTSSRRTSDSPVSLSSIKSRSRALSDSVFQNMIRSGRTNQSPEVDINDESSTDLVVYSQSQTEPDPFRADANTYYTPQTMIPSTPPRTNSVSSHVRNTSKEENLIYSLQAQLTLQTELCGQYETDLRARDELCELLSNKLSGLEQEDIKRRGALRAWKKKVQELERTCRYLEEEVEGSRHESMERSVMDEASSEALRMLHRQIAALEREKADWKRKENSLRDEVGTLEDLVKQRSDDLMTLQQKLWSFDEAERELKSGIQHASDEMEQMGNVSVAQVDEEEIKRLGAERQLEKAEDMERYRLAKLEWEQQRDELLLSVEKVKSEKAALEDDLHNLHQQLKERDDELTMLKAELDAQWHHTETATERTEALENERRELELERETLKTVVDELQEKITSLNAGWDEIENDKIELENELQEMLHDNEALVKERDEMDEQIRSEQRAVDTLNMAIQERDDQVEELSKERDYALENIERLEANLRRRDEEAREYAQRIKESETEAEELREQMNSMKREHSRIVDEQSRALQDAAFHGGEDKMHTEMALKEKAEADLAVRMSKDRIDNLSEELERLRRQVHELQQESADKDLKLVQARKQTETAQEDNNGLNIALDSKQQELELLKRKLGVRGTAGSTPAQPSKVAANRRRDSAVFTATPASRPSSVLSDSGKDALKSSTSSRTETPTSARAALAKSTRVNAAATGAAASMKARLEGSMGPPPDRPRASISGTPTPVARMSSLSKSVAPRASISSTPVRRTASISVDPTPPTKTKLVRPVMSPSPEDKENLEQKLKRRSMIPTPA